MKVICVGHAIKEVLTADQSRNALLAGTKSAGLTLKGDYLVSDGGDGFLETYAGTDTMLETVACLNALGGKHAAPFLLNRSQNLVVMEVALIIGLKQIDPDRRNIMFSGSAGVADLLIAARKEKVEKLIIGLGGSATCDGGIGLLWRLADASGQCRYGCPEVRTAVDMADVPSPDIERIIEWLGPIQITACVDVNNTLLGETGAVHSFAVQKGATPGEVEQLEAFMEDWSKRVERNGQGTWSTWPGSGAAGGLGFALAAIGAVLTPGAAVSMEYTGLANAIGKDDIVIVTEGRFDQTSFYGKAPWAVAEYAVGHSAKGVIFCGIADEAAVSRAKQKGVTIIEYGRNLSAEERSFRSEVSLIDSVKDYLINLSES